LQNWFCAHPLYWAHMTSASETFEAVLAHSAWLEMEMSLGSLPFCCITCQKVKRYRLDTLEAQNTYLIVQLRNSRGQLSVKPGPISPERASEELLSPFEVILSVSVKSMIMIASRVGNGAHMEYCRGGVQHAALYALLLPSAGPGAQGRPPILMKRSRSFAG
jgi:hypothetical protein